jgi:hypothetical protein
LLIINFVFSCRRNKEQLQQSSRTRGHWTKLLGDIRDSLNNYITLFFNPWPQGAAPNGTLGLARSLPKDVFSNA